MIKTKVAFLEGRLLSCHNLKSFQKALIGWGKASPPKEPLLFDHVNRLFINYKSYMMIWPTLHPPPYDGTDGLRNQA